MSNTFSLRLIMFHTHITLSRIVVRPLRSVATASQGKIISAFSFLFSHTFYARATIDFLNSVIDRYSRSIREKTHMSVICRRIFFVFTRARVRIRHLRFYARLYVYTINVFILNYVTRFTDHYHTLLSFKCSISTSVVHDIISTFTLMDVFQCPESAIFTIYMYNAYSFAFS